MTGGMRVLVVEDDPDIASLLRRNFEAEGMTADHAADGDTALQLARHRPYHAIVLDVMLPGKSGIEVCQLLRRHSDAATIIMLSARDTVNDRVEGLAAGADDYLVKPFAFEELMARIRAQQRRRALESQIVADETIRSGKLSFDPSTITLSGFGKTATLTDREADLLLYFFRNEGLPISRDQIFDALWQGQGGVALNVVDVYVGYLRRKLASLSPQARDALSTVRGKGFRYVPPAGTGQG